MERRLAAVLSADVAGYARLMATDDIATIRVLGQCREVMQERTQAFRGRVVDAPGDNLLAEFPSAADAVEAAVAIQERLAEIEQPDELRMQFRIGIHMGDIVADGDAIYGNGVNLSARMQSLSEPGNICVSADVMNQVKSTLSLATEDLGEQKLKNFSEPVRAFRIRVGEERVAAEAADWMVPGFGNRPAIAVLPFENLSRDPEQEYFVDGVVEDLITRLSAWRDIPVIARNSTFAYRGQTVDPTRVGKELGARYVVQGSVRKAGDRVRLSVQVIDAPAATNIWAERYDRELIDIFELQDEITTDIVGQVGPELLKSERNRAMRADPNNLEAWELSGRAWWHLYRFTREENQRARELSLQVIDMDENFIAGWSSLSLTYVYEIAYGWASDFETTIAEALKYAERAVGIDPQSSGAHTILGSVHSMRSDHSRARSELEAAIDLEPSLATARWRLGTTYFYMGEHELALESIELAIRLSPRDPFLFNALADKAFVLYDMKRYDEAIACAQRSIGMRKDYPLSLYIYCAALGQSGQLEMAEAAINELRSMGTEPTIQSLAGYSAFVMPETQVHYSEGLRKAGMRD